MLINSARKMPSIERRISIEFRDPAHQLSENILGSCLWRHFYILSGSGVIHEHLRLENHFLLLLFTVCCMFFESVGSKLASEVV